MKKLKKGTYKNQKSNITSYTIVKATDVFKHNNWNMDKNVDGSGINWNRRFNMYCSMLGMLNEEQQKLILELTNEYTYISGIDYVVQLNLLLTKLYEENYANVRQYNKVYVMPLMSPVDKALKKVKSSTYLAYMFFGTEMSYNKYLDGISFLRADGIEALPIRKINNKESSIIFLVDDFIGTGDTALEALQEFSQAKISKEKIIIISILGMKAGIEKLRDIGIKVFSSFIKDKGITDRYNGDELKKNLQIMESIENQIEIKSDLRFGYGKSEALVTMARTPNNTFPLFWQDNKKKGYVSPFPRR